jgi:single-strand DNA-binding protein
MNVFTGTGRCGQDAEVRFTQAGLAICNFSLAVDAGYGDRKSTLWLRCALFGKRAEGELPTYLTKGTQVAVSGELSMSEWENKDGEKKQSLELNVRELDLVGGRGDSRQGASDPEPRSGDDEEEVPF